MKKIFLKKISDFINNICILFDNTKIFYNEFFIKYIISKQGLDNLFTLKKILKLLDNLNSKFFKRIYVITWSLLLFHL